MILKIYLQNRYNEKKLRSNHAEQACNWVNWAKIQSLKNKLNEEETGKEERKVEAKLSHFLSREFQKTFCTEICLEPCLELLLQI